MMTDLPDILLDLVEKMLYADSIEQTQQIVAEHPELEPYYQIALPLHEALSMMAISHQVRVKAPDEKAVQILEMSPDVSVVVTQNSKGERMANLFEIPWQVLANLMIQTEPEKSDLFWDVCSTLQIGLHHPEYLTNEAYVMLSIMVKKEKLPTTVEALTQFQQALKICLENGLNKEWMETIKKQRSPKGN